MQPGDVVDDRFEIGRVAGSGGMGMVYRATDLRTGQPVALKLLRFETGEGVLRLAREASVLASLRHPAVVLYVGHGKTRDGQPYLAMEWLDGDPLSARLAHAGVTMTEAVELARRVAAGLGAAHALGIVHRDVKPSNVLLVDGLIARAKLLDFGLARSGAASSITRAGNLVGTPGYMSPEQARGSRTLDPRSDVFSLGCLLYKCLTGRGPFEAEDAVAVLARILFDEPRTVRSLRPEVSVDLERLVGRMLAKKPEDRPPDAVAALHELERLRMSGPDAAPTEVEAADQLTGLEKRLVSVLLVLGSEVAASDTTIEHAEWEAGKDVADRVQAALAPFRVRVEPLADQSVVATLGGDATAADQAMRAARCAFAVRAACPGAVMAMATGMDELSSASSVGAVVDRALAVLRAARDGERAPPPAIYADESTAHLLEARCEVLGSAPRLEVVRERALPLEVRTLLGRPTPCVGRERELSSIRAILDEAASEPAARVVLVTSPSGLGKSRLRHELLREVVREGRFDAWIARGEPMAAGSAFAMLGQALRSALGIARDAHGRGAADVLGARVARSVPAADASRVSEFLGELLGIPFAEVESVPLRAAREDARLMGDQMRRAFEDFLAAECARRPVLVVLEDLHWCDVPTVSFIDSALRQSHARPLAVLALARPEVHATFPRLWEGRAMTTMPLGPLPRRAAERLVVEMLGDGLDPKTVESMVGRAGGNAFFLEEIIRAVAEGRTGVLPETVLATAQSRLEALEAEERRILRAASVFGQSFWDAGVGALVQADTQRDMDTRAHLDDLARRELVSARAQSRLEGSREYVFRHAIVQEAAYGMLTDHDRVVGHRLAARWLERVGETDAMALAGHFERAKEPGSAAIYCILAARQALEGHDDAGVIAAAERAVQCGATGEALGEARLLQVEGHRWRGQFEEAERCGLLGEGAFPTDHPKRYAILAAIVTASGQLGHEDRMRWALEKLRSAPGHVGLGHRVIGIARGAAQRLAAGQFDAAAPLLAWLAEHAPHVTSFNPAADATVQCTRAMQGLVAGDPFAYLEGSRLAVAAFERAGDRRNGCIQLVNVGYAHMELGAYGDAERVLVHAMESARRMGLENAYADAGQNLGYAVALLGRTDEGARIELASIESVVLQKLPRMEAGGRGCLALILVMRGDLARAEEEARRAVEVAARLLPTRAFALATLARVRLTRRDAVGALEAASEAMAILEPLGGIEFGEALIRLVYSEALDATGDHAGARAAIVAAKTRLLARAAAISDSAARALFLERVPENRATMVRASSS